jgi:hypothetical protein
MKLGQVLQEFDISGEGHGQLLGERSGNATRNR